MEEKGVAEEAKVKETGQAKRERERVKRNGTRINNRGQGKGKDKGNLFTPPRMALGMLERVAR